MVRNGILTSKWCVSPRRRRLDRNPEYDVANRVLILDNGRVRGPKQGSSTNGRFLLLGHVDLPQKVPRVGIQDSVTVTVLLNALSVSKCDVPTPLVVLKLQCSAILLVRGQVLTNKIQLGILTPLEVLKLQ